MSAQQPEEATAGGRQRKPFFAPYVPNGGPGTPMADWNHWYDNLSKMQPKLDLRPLDAMESCWFRAAFVGVSGFAMGALLGTLFTSFDTTHDMDATKTNTQKIKESFRAMGKSSVHYAKQFASIGAIYSFTECNIEKGRGKVDMTNTLLAGCITGGALAFRSGPAATAFGCGGFAAFSLAIDHFTGRHK